MIQIIIFSFNRALQMDTLLTSLCEKWQSPDYCVDVLYNTSTIDFQKGYDKLIKKFESQTIRFHKESKGCAPYTLRERLNIRNLIHLWRYPILKKPKSNFRPLLIELMENNSSREVMFMTDDAMYIRPVNISQEQLDWISSDPYNNQFTLRTGLGMNKQPHNIINMGTYLAWKAYEVPQNNNWGYHFSVDAHIYNKAFMLYLFKKYIFMNPNTQEGYICEQIRRHKWLKNARSVTECTLLSFPINMVQTFSENETLGVSTEDLNQLYIEGYTMKYPVPETYNTFQQYPSYLELFKNGNTSKYETRK